MGGILVFEFFIFCVPTLDNVRTEDGMKVFFVMNALIRRGL